MIIKLMLNREYLCPSDLDEMKRIGVKELLNDYENEELIKMSVAVG